MASLIASSERAIMASLSRKAQNSVSLQREMFRRAADEHGLSVKVLAGRTQISPSTIREWALGHHAMPAWALGELDLPDDIASLVLDPFKRFINTSEPGDGDLDALGCEAANFTADYVSRKADGKICHIDAAVLGKGAARLRSISSRIVKAA